MITKIRLESIDRLRVGHLVTWDWQKPTQRAAEVTEDRTVDGVRTLTLSDKLGQTIEVTNHTVGDFDLSVPEGWSPRPVAKSADEERSRPRTESPRAYRSRTRRVPAEQYRGDRGSALAIVRLLQRHATHLIALPTAEHPAQRLAMRDPETGVLTVRLTTGPLELLPGDWLIWRDRQLAAVSEEVFRENYVAEF